MARRARHHPAVAGPKRVHEGPVVHGALLERSARDGARYDRRAFEREREWLAMVGGICVPRARARSRSARVRAIGVLVRCPPSAAACNARCVRSKRAASAGRYGRSGLMVACHGASSFLFEKVRGKERKETKETPRDHGPAITQA